MSRGQGGWSEEVCASGSSRGGLARQPAGPSSSSRTTTTAATTATTLEERGPCKPGLRFGVYGWRKRCLYSLVLTLMVIVILNLALTVWLLKVMGFSSEGIGSLKVVPGGIELRGQAAVLDALVASSLRSRRGKNLVLESWSNFTASARAHDGRLLARLTVGEDRVDCVSKGFRITDPRGGVLFSADREQVVVGAEMLRVTGDGGAVFQGSVQTPLVRGESGRGLRRHSHGITGKPWGSPPDHLIVVKPTIRASNDASFMPVPRAGAILLEAAIPYTSARTALAAPLCSSAQPVIILRQPRRLESATRSLKISAPQRVVIESWANEISASCLTDLKLQSVHGAIRLDAKSVFLKGLKAANPIQGHPSREQQQQQQQQPQQHSSRASSHQSPRDTTIYQLCACANGKLFLARPEGTCQADKSIC